MTRREQIEEAAKANFNKEYNHEPFIEGAEWADKNPVRIINWDRVREETIAYYKIMTTTSGTFRGEDILGKIQQFVEKQLCGD